MPGRSIIVEELLDSVLKKPPNLRSDRRSSRNTDGVFE